MNRVYVCVIAISCKFGNAQSLILGGINLIDTPQSGNVADITKQGVYLFGTSATNTPDSTSYWYITATQTNTASIMNLLAYKNDASIVYSGQIRSGAVTWSRLDNFGCSTLASLGSALGGTNYLYQSCPENYIYDLGEKVFLIVITATSSTSIPAIIATNGSQLITLSSDTHIQVGGEEPNSSTVALWWIYIENGHVKVKNKRNSNTSISVYYTFASR